MSDQKFEFQTHTRASRVVLTITTGIVIALFLAPAVVSRQLLQDWFFILTMLTLAANWNLLAGYAGLVSVGQQLFVGLGAYSLFFVTIVIGLQPVWGLALGAIVALVAALAAKVFLFRLNGAYFAVGSWVVAEVVRLFVSQSKTLGGGTGKSLPTGSTREVLGVEWVSDLFGVRSTHAFDIVVYLFALTLASVTILGAYLFLRSRGGLGLTAARDNSIASQSVGVNVRSLQSAVYLWTALSTGIAGALIYLQKARISPDAAFSVFDWTAYVIFIVVIGGIGTIEGPIIGVLVLFLMQSLFADFGATYLILLGVVTIMFMIGAPKGLWGLAEERLNWSVFPIRRRLVQRND